MAQFTAKDVQSLRQATGAGMMDAKRALEETDGDANRAARWLAEKGLAQSARRADRPNEQGAVAVARANGAAAIVELKSETDYVAKSDEFKVAAESLAELVASGGEEAAAQGRETVDKLKVTLKENIELGRVVRFEAADGAVVDTYLHIQNERGVIAVMVELAGGDQTLAHEVALHVASMRPEWISRDDVPPERVAEEREVLETRTRNEGKPEQAVAKIVEGRLNGFFRDHCLLEQPYARDSKQTVAQLLGDATVTRFSLVRVGQ